MTQMLVAEFKRRVFEESYPRIIKCLQLLNEDAIWYRPNDSSNSVGNLIIHLCGNMEQWICSGLFGEMDHRQRSGEFDLRMRFSKKALLATMADVKEKVMSRINEIDEPSLKTIYDVQVFKETGCAILVHVIEHFSYQTGQIAYITKMLLDEDLAFYGDMNLDVN